MTVPSYLTNSDPNQPAGSDAYARAGVDLTARTNFVERIKAPVFIAAGGADDRVPKAHAERLHAALEKAGKPVELLIKTTEGHGYYDQENQIELYQKMLAFMDAHIGAD